MLLALSLALAAPIAPIREIQHPLYQDRAGVELTWPEVRSLAAGTEGLRKVRARRAGRSVLRVSLLAVGVGEAFLARELAAQGSTWAWVMGVQAGATALAGTILIAEIPVDLRVNRARMLRSVNTKIRLGWQAPIQPHTYAAIE